MEEIGAMFKTMTDEHIKRQEKMIEQLKLMNKAIECINRRYGDSDESDNREV